MSGHPWNWQDKTYVWHILFAEQLLFWAFCVCLTLDIYLQLVKKCDAKNKQFDFRLFY